MRLQTLTRLLALALVLTLVTLGCRREDETPPIPTPLPTAALPDTRAPDTDGAPANTPTPRPQPTATAVPQPAVNADAIDWPPQLVYSSPAPGEEVLLDGAITLRFDQPMDPDSVESAFAVTDAGGSRIAGEFSWPRPDTLVFTPRSLRRQADYRVQIADTAEAANGRPLRSAIDLSLRTVGFLEVGQVIPAADTAAVDTDSSITVFFNRPVVPVVTSAQQAGLPQPLTITPAVAGSGEWVSSSIYRFLPAGPLAGATTYTVAVAEGLADVAGAVLEEGFTWTFTTRSPEVVTIDPANNATGVVPTRPITITFNMPMDPASTEAAVLLPGVDVGNTAVDFSWQDDNRILVLTPRQPLQLDTEYQVTIGASAAAASGQATLAQDEVSAFSTVPFPAVLYTTPARNAVADTYASGISIGFASPMDLSTFEDDIVIEPEPPRINSFWNEFNNELYLNFALARNATYRVTIPGDAADPYGNKLGEAYTWQFDTPDYPPIASFNLPQQVSQLSTSFVTEVGIIHRNVSSLDVSLTDLGLPLGLLINPFDLYDYRPAAEPRQTWSLPPEEDGLATLALAGDGTLPTGVYYLAVTTPELQQETRYWQNQRHLLVVADTYASGISIGFASPMDLSTFEDDIVIEPEP
ncbi:MAG: Ig-like domain-containing protein, partial [Anaerolineales bacterium]|nr:Ig-like domain-containing protein [Anaerolineales bacterium]